MSCNYYDIVLLVMFLQVHSSKRKHKVVNARVNPADNDVVLNFWRQRLVGVHLGYRRRQNIISFRNILITRLVCFVLLSFGTGEFGA